MKKLIIVILTVSLFFTVFTGCGGNTSNDGETNGQTQTPQEQPSATPIDISTLSPDEYYNFDPATNTILGFADGVVGITDIEIPAKINGTAVLNIGANAFNFKGLNSVVLPDGLMSIGVTAFKENNLTEIILPDSLTEISLGAFWKNKLTELTIPDGITTIDVRAFSDNEISKLTLPDSITLIKRSAFQSNKLKTYTLPPNVKQIESIAFQDNGMESIVFNEGLERIDGYAFFRNNLTTLTIPASVKLIGEATEELVNPQPYENNVFEENNLSKITMLGDDTVFSPFVMGDNNYFRDAYYEGGAGTYIGEQYGPWEKTSGD